MIEKPTPMHRTHAVDRRTLLAGVGAFGLAATAPVCARAAAENPAPAADPSGTLPPTPHFEAAYAAIVGNGTPIEGRVVLELPEDAENGNIVPYKISIESPMTAEDYIARVHLLSTQNPQALVATFHFTPLSGVATVAGRMRLARTQDVVAVALTSADNLLVARRLIHVGIGGCGAE